MTKLTKPLPLNFPLAFAWTFGATSGLLWLARLGASLRTSAATDVVQIGAIEALVFLLAILGVLSLHGRDAPLATSLGLRATHPFLPVIGVLLGIAAHFPAESVDGLVQRYFPQSADDLAAESALLQAESPARLVLILVIVACVGPLVEELFFRGALFGALRPHHALAATAAVTGGCFVAGHLDIRRWPALIVVAIVLSHLRAVSGSLLPSLALHVVFNAVTVIAFFVGTGGAGKPSPVGLVPTLVGSVATVALMAVAHRVALGAEAARVGRLEDAE